MKNISFSDLDMTSLETYTAALQKFYPDNDLSTRPKQVNAAYNEDLERMKEI